MAAKRISDPQKAKTSSAKEVWKKSSYRDGNISFEFFLVMSQKDCFYCGAKPHRIYNVFQAKRKEGRSASDFAVKNGNFKYNGLDRVDNNLSHTVDNIVPCCFDCNKAKSSKSVKEFKRWIIKVYENLINKKLIKRKKQIKLWRNK